ncbi:type II toxin-antitoxin system HicB family antitoxin [Kitasatospora sp. NPDC052896]|uniref:type II toxin-antitoxin system HicB family antitoxin n=1 Tax=Kitasatospora sp. NPDC052896 TaxID=3364061 RepID=UPI0037C94227
MPFVTMAVTYTFEDGVWVAREPVTGCAAEGTTVEQAQEMITEALELYYEDATRTPEQAPAMTGLVQVEVPDWE